MIVMKMWTDALNDESCQAEYRCEGGNGMLPGLYCAGEGSQGDFLAVMRSGQTEHCCCYFGSSTDMGAELGLGQH